MVRLLLLLRQARELQRVPRHTRILPHLGCLFQAHTSCQWHPQRRLCLVRRDMTPKHHPEPSRMRTTITSTTCHHESRRTQRWAVRHRRTHIAVQDLTERLVLMVRLSQTLGSGGSIHCIGRAAYHGSGMSIGYYSLNDKLMKNFMDNFQAKTLYRLRTWSWLSGTGSGKPTTSRYRAQGPHLKARYHKITNNV